jgi:hypothetical protein
MAAPLIHRGGPIDGPRQDSAASPVDRQWSPTPTPSAGPGQSSEFVVRLPLLRTAPQATGSAQPNFGSP